MTEQSAACVTTGGNPVTHIYELEALTDIWTGTARVEEKWNGRERRNELVDVIVSDRLIATGLLGSIRWWFEVLVRGLGGNPCDPSNTTCIDRKHCVACEFFGCTGWARKFRFDVLTESGAIQRAQIKRNEKFKLRFTPLRATAPEERALLDLTLRLIAEYGAIGGKTVFKPTDESSRQSQVHHQDFGLIELLKAPDPSRPPNEAALRRYTDDSRWRSASQDGIAWANAARFWAVRGQYLARQDAGRSRFNQAIGRDGPKDSAGNGDSWLAGRRARSAQGRTPEVKAESKKVFSFKSHPRTFGFVNPHSSGDRVTIEEIKNRLGAAWQRTIVEEEVAPNDEKKIQLLTGDEILKRLLKAQGETR